MPTFARRPNIECVECWESRRSSACRQRKLAVSSGLVYALWVDGIDFRQVSPLAATAHGEHTGASAAAPQEFRRRVLAWFGEH
jgi:hypothetical protein